MNKYDHVRQAKQSRGHQCHWPTCRRQVPPAKWGCMNHWYMLPVALRNKIWAAYRAGQEENPGRVSREYLEAAQEVQEWIKGEIAAGRAV